MHTDDLALRQHGVQIGLVYAQAGRIGGLQVRVVGPDLGSDRLEEARRAPAHIPHAENADSLAGNLVGGDSAVLWPAPGLHLAIHDLRLTQAHKRQKQRVFGHRVGDPRGGMSHGDATVVERIADQTLHAAGGVSHDPQAIRRSQDAGIERHKAPTGNEGVDAGQMRGQFARRPVPPVFVLNDGSEGVKLAFGGRRQNLAAEGLRNANEDANIWHGYIPRCMKAHWRHLSTAAARRSIGSATAACHPARH